MTSPVQTSAPGALPQEASAQRAGTEALAEKAPAELHGAPKVFIETFGCQMNYLDTEIVRGRLLERRFEFCEDRSAADVIAFNTCAIRDHAEERVRGRIRELRALKQERPEVVLAVLGCMAQREGEDLLRQFPHLDLVCGTREFGRIAELIDEVRTGAGPVLALGESDTMPERTHVDQRPTQHSAYVTIQRGCDRRCTYCVVPRTRGPEVERTMDDIEAEVQRLVDDGVIDVTLLGQIVNSYGRKIGGRASMARLLRRLDRVEGLKRLRFITSFPTLLTPDLMQAMRDCDTVVSYLHLPVQSGSNTCLRRMARGYSADAYRKLVDRLRDTVPGVELATDVIVGFCGETEEEFEQTAQLMRDVEFVQAFVFKYSNRPGTAADRAMKDDVPYPEKQRRNRALLALQEEIQLRRNRLLFGRDLEVLVEGPSRRNPQMLTARTSANRIVHFPGDPGLAGEFVRVRVQDGTALSLSGQRVEA